MRIYLGLVLSIGVAWGLASPQSVQAECKVYSTTQTYTAGQAIPNVCDTSGAQKSTLATPTGDSVMDETNDAVNVNMVTLFSGEDQTNNVLRVEGQFSYAQDDADLVVKASAGYLHAIVCYGEDGTAEAGSVAIRDATSAGAGTVVWQETIAAAAYTSKSIIMDIVMPTGIVIDFTTTTDVFCLVSYR